MKDSLLLQYCGCFYILNTQNRSETTSYEGLQITLLHLPEQELHRLPWKLNVRVLPGFLYMQIMLLQKARHIQGCDLRSVTETLALHVIFST